MGGGGWFDGGIDWFGGLGGGAGAYPQVAQVTPSDLMPGMIPGASPVVPPQMPGASPVVPPQMPGASPVVPDAGLAGGMMLDDYGDVVPRGRGGMTGVPQLRGDQRPDWEAGPMANPPPMPPMPPVASPQAPAPAAPTAPRARVTLDPPGPPSPSVMPSAPPTAMDYDPLSGAPIGVMPAGIPARIQGQEPPAPPAPAMTPAPSPRAAPPAVAPRAPGQAQAAPMQPGPVQADGTQTLDATPQALPPIGAPREVAMAPGMRQQRFVPEGVHPVSVAMAGAEGTGQNPNSAAVGVGQFMPATWMSMVRRHGAQAGYDPQLIARAAEDPQAREEVLAWRRDNTEVGRARALQMVEAYRRENVRALERAGFSDPSPADQYMAHFLGAEGAIRFLRGRGSDASQPVDQVVSPQALAANVYRDRNGNPRWSPFYEFGPNGAQRVRTIGEVYDWADRTIQRQMRNGQGGGQTQVADAAGGAGVTPGAPAGMGAGAALAQPGQAPGGQQDDDMRRMLRQALERLNQPDQTAEERQQARRDRWGRVAMQIGGGILAANQPSSTPRSPISEGLGRGMAQAAQSMADDRRQDRADRQASRQRDASLVSTAVSLRPRLVSAGGALYRDDPLATGAPERVAEAPETWHQPVTRTNPDGSTTVLQAGSRGGVRDLGDGSVGGRGAGAGGRAQGTAVERNAAAYMRAHPEATEAQALDWARNRGTEAESTLRNRAVNAAQRYRDAANQPLPLDQQTRIAEALTQYYRDGDATALQERIRQAQPQPQQAQPGMISRMVDGLLGRGTPAGTPAPTAGAPPDGLSGAGGATPPPPPPATPGAAQAAPRPRGDTARGATPEADRALRQSTQQAEAIRQRYRRGEITRDEATRQLQALGFQ